MADTRRIWLVWSPTGPYEPRVEHRTKDEAIRVSKVMAERHRGRRFYVVETIGFSELPPVYTDMFDDIEEPW